MFVYFKDDKGAIAKVVGLTGQVIVYYGTRNDGSSLMKKFTSYPAAAQWIERKGYVKIK